MKQTQPRYPVGLDPPKSRNQEKIFLRAYEKTGKNPQSCYTTHWVGNSFFNLNNTLLIECLINPSSLEDGVFSLKKTTRNFILAAFYSKKGRIYPVSEKGSFFWYTLSLVYDN